MLKMEASVFSPVPGERMLAESPDTCTLDFSAQVFVTACEANLNQVLK